MRVRRFAAVLGCASLVVVSVASGAAAARPADPGANGAAVASAVRVCAHAPAGYAECHSWRVVGPDGKPTPSVPVSYNATQLQAAYGLTAAIGRGAGQTIAIIDAYDNPRAEGNLAEYRRVNGLPDCTSTTGCFTKVNQRGTSSYPVENVGWAQEIDLDLAMASAICPNCKLLLVEADDSSLANLGAAVDWAATHGATQISNSYGGSDLPDASYGKPYDHPGIAITASTGDNGFGVSFPASSQYVTAVGGTSLRQAAVTSTKPRGWTETVWSGAGSGCSRYNPKLPAQVGVATGCSNRAVADVSAVADPNTGVRVYTYASATGPSSWMVFGGTSASAPIIAGVYALAADLGGQVGNARPYAGTASLNDVTSGTNGRCRPTVLCTGGAGYDGPTGLGTPNGIGAF